MLKRILYVIVFLKVVSLFLRAVPPNWTHVNHPCAILQKCSSFDGNIDIGQVLQAKVQEHPELILS